MGAPTVRAWLDEVLAAESADHCIDWPFARDSKGYGYMRDAGRSTRAHRVVCTLAHGEAPAGGMHAAHSCGRAMCVNPAHIRWATPEENSADQLSHGTIARGSRSGSSKLTEADVIAIRLYVAREGYGAQRAMADRFGVSEHHISRIVHRHLWAWLDADLGSAA